MKSNKLQKRKGVKYEMKSKAKSTYGLVLVQIGESEIVNIYIHPFDSSGDFITRRIFKKVPAKTKKNLKRLYDVLLHLSGGGIYSVVTNPLTKVRR